MTVPNLRFKFDDHLKEFSLSEAGRFYGGLSGKTKDDFGVGNSKFITYMNVFTNVIAKRDMCESVIVGAQEKQNSVVAGDILFTQSSETAEEVGMASVWIHHFDVYLNSFSFGFRLFDKKSIDPVYLVYLMRSHAYRKKISVQAQGISRYNLSSSRLSSLKIKIPEFREQQKIAAFFTALDEKIHLSQLKLDLFEKLKSGVMQKLFSHDYRFKKKDGSPFEPWESFTVGDLAQVVGGGTPSTLNPDYWDGDIYWLTPTEINSKYVHASNRKITLNGLNNSSAKLLPKRAILLTTRATLGACSINNQDNPVCTNQGFQSLVCKNFVDDEFLYYVITEKAFQKSMIKNASGSTFQEISSKNLKSISVHLPSIDEQRQIVLLLSTIDQKIDCVKRSLKVLKAQKTAFMQQMFV